MGGTFKRSLWVLAAMGGTFDRSLWVLVAMLLFAVGCE